MRWEDFHASGFEFYDNLNFLKAGLQNADILTTVSPTYAKEIQSPRFGFQLDGLLRRRSGDLFGILNGIDYSVWNPETDPLLPFHYSHTDMSGKKALKSVLQKEMGLPEKPDVPVIGMVSRLADQKGFGELCGPTYGSLYSICKSMDLQFIIVGTGAQWCEAELETLQQKLSNLKVRITFDNRLAHLVEAGSDFFLMPSRYEPCGLNQMYSLRYGTLPIVRRTGGLADTVDNYNEQTGSGNGFVFDDLTPQAIYDVVGWAVWAYYNRSDHIRAMRERAMQIRYSWKDSALRYAELYHWAIDRRLGRFPRTW